MHAELQSVTTETQHLKCATPCRAVLQQTIAWIRIVQHHLTQAPTALGDPANQNTSIDQTRTAAALDSGTIHETPRTWRTEPVGTSSTT